VHTGASSKRAVSHRNGRGGAAERTAGSELHCTWPPQRCRGTLHGARGSWRSVRGAARRRNEQTVRGRAALWQRRTAASSAAGGTDPLQPRTRQSGPAVQRAPVPLAALSRCSAPASVA
jgi:hypothetical protein